MPGGHTSRMARPSDGKPRNIVGMTFRASLDPGGGSREGAGVAWPLTEGDPMRLGLKLQLDTARREAKERWAEFEKARQPAVEAITMDKTPAKQVLAEIAEVQQRYYEARDEALAAEEALMSYLDGIEGTPAKVGGNGAKPLTGITDAVLKQVGGLEGMKAITSGTFTLPGFFDPAIAALPSREMFVQTVIRTLRVETPIYGYLQQTVSTNAAAPVA